MEDYRDKTVLELRELLADRGLVPSRWMLTYIRKAEAVEILTSNASIDESFTKELRDRQGAHMNKALAARKKRDETFGVKHLTHEERVKRVVRLLGPLKFVDVRVYEDGFESATGSRRGKHAIIFQGRDDIEVILTKGEAKLAAALGVDVPFSAFSFSKNATKSGKDGMKTLRDIFGE